MRRYDELRNADSIDTERYVRNVRYSDRSMQASVRFAVRCQLSRWLCHITVRTSRLGCVADRVAIATRSLRYISR